MTEDSENPYQSPEAASEVAQPPDKSPEDLRQIAIYHKGLMVCVLVQAILTFLQLLPPAYGLPRGSPPPAAFILARTVMGALIIPEIVWILLACLKLYRTWEAFLLMLAPCVPIAGLFIVMGIQGKARRVLQKHRCRMGWFGADLSQFR